MGGLISPIVCIYLSIASIKICKFEGDMQFIFAINLRSGDSKSKRRHFRVKNQPGYNCAQVNSFLVWFLHTRVIRELKVYNARFRRGHAYSTLVSECI